MARRLVSILSLIGSLAVVYVPWLVGGSAVSASGPVAASAPPVAELSVRVREWGTEPALLHVPANTPVTLSFADEGELAHEIVVPDLGLDVALSPDEHAATQAQLSPAAVGVYPWFCTLPDHQAYGTHGWLVVGGTLDDHLEHTSAS